MADSMFLIAGCGVSGRAAARLASFLKYDYSLADEKDSPELRSFVQSLSHPPREIVFGWTPGTPLPANEQTIISPGIRKGSPFREALENAGGIMIGELEFALDRLPCPYIGITGTNGKTTVTELTTVLLQAIGVKAVSAGNIGDALSDIVIRAINEHLSMIVVEISSFQLESMRFPHPAAAAVLNIASDHLDRHISMDEYAKTKFKLLRAMRSGCIINHNLRRIAKCCLHDNTERLTFSTERANSFYFLRNNMFLRDGKELFDYSSMKLKGRHNAENVMAALALLEAVKGVDALRNPFVLRALRAFEPAPHRIQTFLTHNKIQYIDDSKATNPHAVNAAIDSIESGKIVLILGGLDKDMEFRELIPHLKRVRTAFLIGQSAEKIQKELTGYVRMVRCQDFPDAVKKACAAAWSGDTVMLSPACASMDMFRDYKDRGEQFQRLVRETVLGVPLQQIKDTDESK